MAGDRLLPILGQLTAGGEALLGATRLCEVCADVVGMTGAGIMLMSDDMPRGSVCSSNEVSATGSAFRFVVHQASGMVAAQLEVSVAEALIRLRAYAFAHDRLLTDVAEEVVSRRLRFQ